MFQCRGVVCRVETLVLRPVTGTDCDVARIPAAPRSLAPHHTAQHRTGRKRQESLLPGFSTHSSSSPVLKLSASSSSASWVTLGDMDCLGCDMGVVHTKSPLADGSLPACSEIPFQLQTYLSRVSRLNFQQRQLRTSMAHHGGWQRQPTCCGRSVHHPAYLHALIVRIWPAMPPVAQLLAPWRVVEAAVRTALRARRRRRGPQDGNVRR